MRTRLLAGATSPAGPAVGPLLGWLACASLALTLLAGTASAQAPDFQSPEAAVGANQEPITPVPAAPDADPLKVALGEQLFQDPRLSRDGTRACVSCHDTRSNGADGNRRDIGLNGSELPLNTNTVFNAALSFRLNWEGNFRTPEAQAEASLASSEIMGTSADDVVGRLSVDAAMARQFNEAYGRPLDRANLLDAIATYERSLVTPESRFDRWLEGDTAALTAEEQRGYRLFKSLGCISCHQGVNIGGNLYERYGIFRTPSSSTPQILRVPSLRNVATTAPYFHDGSAATLNEAVRKMGVAQLDRTLSDQEIDAIVSFLDTLTGNYRGIPVAESPR